MAPTTLITFMVRTPPTTRTVSLYGSWDNFSKAYPLQRDSRIGPEHWSGCHKFSNIIFDGDSNEAGYLPREGGLKMGGTYWYYYKLDDDLEFYNAAEPTTTQCPLLPGQLVNVLQVPYALSGNRSRNASMSSTSSEQRTMEPGDKYVNPGQVRRPKLERLQTSPTRVSGGWSSSAPSSSSVSATATRSGWSASTSKSSDPSSASTLRMPSLSRKTSHSSIHGNQSPSKTLASGIMTAFKSLTSPRSRSVERVEGGCVRQDQDLEKTDNFGLVRGKSASQTRSGRQIGSADGGRSGAQQEKPEHDLLFRRRPKSGGSMDSLRLSSFGEHRRQRSRSRESRSQSVRNSLELSDMTAEGVNELAERRKQLSTVKEVASAQNTPGLGLGADATGTVDFQKATAALDLEKRLPTLPNTPSSAYPASATESEGSKARMSATEKEQSHFSSTTIYTDSSAETPMTESERSSEFSESIYSGTGTSWALTESEMEEEEEEEEEKRMNGSWDGEAATTPRTGQTEYGTEIEDTPQTSSTFPPEAVPDWPREKKTTTTAAMARTATATATMTTGWATSGGSQYQDYHQYYRLPADEFGSEETLKSAPIRLTSREGPLPEITHGFQVPTFEQFMPKSGSTSRGGKQWQVQQLQQQQQQQQAVNVDGRSGLVAHSNSMQKLLDELSYLANMIQR